MIVSRYLWRFTLMLGAALTLGLVSGRAAAESTVAAAVLVPLAIVVVAALVWHFAQRSTRSLRFIQDFVADWTEDLQRPLPTAATLPELEPLLSTLRQVQRALLSARGQQVEAMAGLERDTLLLRSVLETMVESVAAVDEASRMIYVNEAARRLLELGDRKVVGRLLHEVVRSSALQELVASVLESGGERETEVELNRKDRVVTASAGPLPLEPKPGVVVVLHDVTELRRLERVRRDFASNVSHELKTPLTSIQAYADALLDGGIDDPAINRGFVERIVQQSERLGELIYDLLNLSRIESQEQLLDMEPLDLGQVVRDCLPAHLSIATTRELDLSSDLAEGEIALRGDREALRTIIDNLLRNAMTYTPAHGSVSVRVRKDQGRGILEVQDTGIGIPREHHQRIFERFYRVDRARSREVGGTGLGLAIVKHLVELSHGTIAVESELGRGSLFRISWPLIAHSDSSQPSHSEGLAQQGGPLIKS